MGRQKEFEGVVLSDRMQKTVIVKVMSLMKHPKYSKIIKRYNKFKAHDEKNSAKMGDLVRIRETRPLSKDKRFRVIKILKQAKPSIEIKEETA